MSVTGPDFWRAECGGVLVSAADETCFFCGKRVNDPAITWHGETGEIWLHPGCAGDFSVRLLRDVHEWQRRTGRRFGDTAT